MADLPSPEAQRLSGLVVQALEAARLAFDAKLQELGVFDMLPPDHEMICELKVQRIPKEPDA